MEQMELFQRYNWESPTLDHDEHKKVIEIAVKETNGKIPVIAGTGSTQQLKQ